MTWPCRTDAALAVRIARDVGFPSSIVDSTTLAPAEATRAEARPTGYDDAATTESEAFHQW